MTIYITPFQLSKCVDPDASAEMLAEAKLELHEDQKLLAKGSISRHIINILIGMIDAEIHHRASEQIT